MMVVDVRKGTCSSPGRSGIAGRAPVLMKIRSARMIVLSPSRGRISSSRGPRKLASAMTRSRFSVARSRFSLPSRQLSTMSRFLCLHRSHVHGDRAGGDSVVRGSATKIGHPGGGDHRLGGRAALVDAGAAHVLALHQSGFPAGLGQAPGQRHARLTGSDDHRIEVTRGCHGFPPSFRATVV